MKILVAVDGSRYSKRMLAYLAAHDEWLGAHHAYTVLTVVPPVPARAAAALPREVLKAHHEEEAERVLKPIRAFFAKQGLAAEFAAKAGAAAEVIATLADKGRFDLLMLGSHGHGALGNLVLGSVATQVLARCSTPVLLVR
ncbi:MAG: universal stress protein [Burkholderiaceae bacterium]|nr:universal stress protein [Burkholderiaceae bacterium]